MILAATGWKSIDGVLLAVIIVLLAGSGVLALAETSLVRGRSRRPGRSPTSTVAARDHWSAWSSGPSGS